ncbi:MAG: diaminopimelate decarboxylase [Candidatus Bathyarchaeia archaeon]
MIQIDKDYLGNVMLRFPLSRRGDILFVEGVSTIDLADEFDTPLYVMSESRVKENYRRLRSAFHGYDSGFHIFYSAKANTNLELLKVLEGASAHVDVVSPGEVYIAKMAGFSSDRILFTGTSVQDDELDYLIKEDVLINIDSLSQLGRLLERRVPEVISFRVNPIHGAGHHEYVVTAGKTPKFGLWIDDVIEGYRRAADAGVSRFGIQMHIGSGILEPEPHLRATETLLKIAGKVTSKLGLSFEFIDLGGGFGVPYRPEDEPLDVEALANGLIDLIEDGSERFSLGNPEIWIEPGRYLVADAGLLLTKINTLKETPHKKFAGVDAGFNTLLRPTLYNSYHHILLANRTNKTPSERYDVVGPICETGDVLAENRSLPKLSEGDLLAILTTGAYGYSMSSQYNSRPRPAEVLVNKNSYRQIRARETFRDLLPHSTKT